MNETMPTCGPRCICVAALRKHGDTYRLPRPVWQCGCAADGMVPPLGVGAQHQLQLHGLTKLRPRRRLHAASWLLLISDNLVLQAWQRLQDRQIMVTV